MIIMMMMMIIIIIIIISIFVKRHMVVTSEALEAVCASYRTYEIKMY